MVELLTDPAAEVSVALLLAEVLTTELLGEPVGDVEEEAPDPPELEQAARAPTAPTARTDRATV